MVWGLLSLTGELLPHLDLQLQVRSEVADVGLSLTFPSLQTAALGVSVCGSCMSPVPRAGQAAAPEPGSADPSSQKAPLPHEEVLQVKPGVLEAPCPLGGAGGPVPRV